MVEKNTVQLNVENLHIVLSLGRGLLFGGERFYFKKGVGEVTAGHIVWGWGRVREKRGKDVKNINRES